jgi:hypothetical protein
MNLVNNNGAIKSADWDAHPVSLVTGKFDHTVHSTRFHSGKFRFIPNQTR